MANYSKIKRAEPLQSRLAMAVEGSRKSKKWEYIGEVKRRTGKLRREAVRRLDKGNTFESKTAQDRYLCLWPFKRLKVQLSCEDEFQRVGLEEQRAISCVRARVLSHHCGLTMFGNSEVFFVSLALLFLCFVIIIKYSRAQRRTQASDPYSYPSLLL